MAIAAPDCTATMPSTVAATPTSSDGRGRLRSAINRRRMDQCEQCAHAVNPRTRFRMSRGWLTSGAPAGGDAASKRSCKPMACSGREESAITQIPDSVGHLGETRHRHPAPARRRQTPRGILKRVPDTGLWAVARHRVQLGVSDGFGRSPRHRVHHRAVSQGRALPSARQGGGAASGGDRGGRDR